MFELKTHKPRNLIKWIIAIFETKTRKGAICKFDQMMIKLGITLLNEYMTFQLQSK